MVRGFQTDEQSSSGLLGWRPWDVAKMESFRVCESTFANTRPGYVRRTRICNQCTANSSIWSTRQGLLFAKAKGGTLIPLPDARVINVNYSSGDSAGADRRNSDCRRISGCS